VPVEGITKIIVVDSPAEAVYRSVATADGFRGWWCKNVSGSDSNGGELVLKFPEGHVCKMSLAKTTKSSKVEWTVTDHNEMKEWIGTSIVFSISSAGPRKSKVGFLHAGLTPQCECYGPCDGAWSYLMGSLKDYVEKGKGGAV
jgi:uncharacterized protein YndB with AHSA1/START domain